MTQAALTGDAATTKVRTIRTRTVHELRQLAAITLYLFVCFGALVLFKSAILRGVGGGVLPWGFAALKAVITAKFMMVGHALRLGESDARRPLIWPTLKRSVLFLVLLVVLTIIEEMLSALLHGRPVEEAVRSMGGGTVMEAIATLIILLLVLIPYFAFRTLGDVVGEDRLLRTFFVSRAAIWEGAPPPIAPPAPVPVARDLAAAGVATPAAPDLS